MTITQLATKIAKLEGKRHDAPIGDVREILKILVEICAQEVAIAQPELTDWAHSGTLQMLIDRVENKADKLSNKILRDRAKAAKAAKV